MRMLFPRWVTALATPCKQCYCNVTVDCCVFPRLVCHSTS